MVGRGTFDSASLGAQFSVFRKCREIRLLVSLFGHWAAPFVGPSPGGQDPKKDRSIGGKGTETITFASEKNAFGLYWGSVDPYNSIKFYDGDTLVASYTGAVFARCSRTETRVRSRRTDTCNSRTCLPSTKWCSRAVERVRDRQYFRRIHSGGPAQAGHGQLSVHDADIGDTLTAFQVGNATVEYNGSTTMPGNIDVSVLLDGGDVTFDST